LRRERAAGAPLKRKIGLMLQLARWQLRIGLEKTLLSANNSIVI
jgi:hypothetical protein